MIGEYLNGTHAGMPSLMARNGPIQSMRLQNVQKVEQAASKAHKL
jgi:hypothetical protein